MPSEPLESRVPLTVVGMVIFVSKAAVRPVVVLDPFIEELLIILVYIVKLD